MSGFYLTATQMFENAYRLRHIKFLLKHLEKWQAINYSMQTAEVNCTSNANPNAQGGADVAALEQIEQNCSELKHCYQIGLGFRFFFFFW